MVIYEISPKEIDIQEGYNKNFHEDHWMLKTWFPVIVLRYDDVICESCWWVIMFYKNIGVKVCDSLCKHESQ